MRDPCLACSPPREARPSAEALSGAVEKRRPGRGKVLIETSAARRARGARGRTRPSRPSPSPPTRRSRARGSPPRRSGRSGRPSRRPRSRAARATARVGEGRAAADRRHLEPGEAQRDLEAALDAPSGAVAHRARADHAEVLAGGREDRGDRRGGREGDRLHPGGDRAVRPGPGKVEQVVRARPQDAPNRVVRQRGLGEDRLAVAALEVLERRLLVAAHVRLEDRALGPDRRALHHVAHVQDVRVAGHHVRPDRVAGRPAPEDVTHRADDVRLHLAQTRELRERRVVLCGDPVLHRRELIRDPLGELDRVGGARADEARGARDPVGEDVGAEAARLRDGQRPALHRGGQPALGVRERDEDGVPRASGLDHLAAGLLQLVLAELELDRADDRDRGHGDAGQHLLRARERLEVEPRHIAV